METTAADAPRLRAPKLAERLFSDLVERIRDGKLAAGAKLPTELELVRDHRVSRAVVREAISRLQAAGLVDSRQGVGTFVRETTPSRSAFVDASTITTMRDVMALLEFRISFETEAAALAAHRHTPEQLHNLDARIAHIQQMLDSGNFQTKTADFEYHLAIAAATGNRYFTDVLHHLGVGILPRERIDLRYMAPDSAAEYLTRSNREHRDIYNAIARRDSDGARAAMRTHLTNSRERLQQLAQPA